MIQTIQTFLVTTQSEIETINGEVPTSDGMVLTEKMPVGYHMAMGKMIAYKSLLTLLEEVAAEEDGSTNTTSL